MRIKRMAANKSNLFRCYSYYFVRFSYIVKNLELE